MRIFYYKNCLSTCSWIGVISIIFFFSSCDVTKHTTYFQNIIRDTTISNLVGHPEPTNILPGDLLSVTVASLSPENTTLYNVAPDAVDDLKGYLVDKDGNINLFKLGKVHAAGLTKVELSQKLQEAFVPYLSQNIVTVGIQNRHVTMMGAVSSKVLPLTDQMTLLDALSQSGDIGMKGKADNILVVREQDSGKQKTFVRLNLTNNSIFNSPYYYLKPNDIVYVEPQKTPLTFVSVLSIVLSTTSFVFLMIDRIFR